MRTSVPIYINKLDEYRKNVKSKNKKPDKSMIYTNLLPSFREN